MKRTFLSLLAVTAVVAMAPNSLSAQTADSESPTMSIAIDKIVYIDVSSSTIALPALTAAQMRAGQSGAQSITLSYGGNTAFSLRINNVDMHLVGTTDPLNTISAGRVFVSLDGGTASQLSSEVTVASVAAGDYTSTASFYLAFSAHAKPDTYTMPILFQVNAL